MKKKILVLTDTMPWGHRSIAKAIYGYLKEKEKEMKWEVQYAEIKAETGVGNDFYQLYYRFSPKVGKIAPIIARSKMAGEIFNRLAELNLKNLKWRISRMKPDLIISCYLFHSRSLALMKKRGKQNFKLWTIVADPWTSTVASFIKGADLHLVYDEVEEEAAIEAGIEKEKVLKTGWWVRPQMYRKCDREMARKKLGFTDDRPVVFVGGGSLGTNSLTRILPVLMILRKKVGFIFNTGTDRLAYNMVEEYKRIFGLINNRGLVQIKNLGWIDNMAEVLSACDVVFGKAGPNFLFDVVAVGKPFVAITHIGGQEDGNIELIKEKRLGWVKEKPGEAASFLINYLKNPKKYNEIFDDDIRKEAKNNRGSLERIVERIKKDEMGKMIQETRNMIHE